MASFDRTVFQPIAPMCKYDYWARVALLLTQCAQDMLDGFFPYEYKDKYPDGGTARLALTHPCFSRGAA